MPLVETLPVGPGCVQWPVWGTTARIVVTEPSCVDDAADIVRAELHAIAAACSRFERESEVHDVLRAGGRPVDVSERLAALVRVALDAAAATDGDVDPTLGLTMCALGYDRDFAHLSDAAINAGMDIRTLLRVVPEVDWRDVRLDGRTLTVPRGVLLDLGATAKAWAADRCAALVADNRGTGVLVALGGDIATAGPAPVDGWAIRVQDGPGEPACTVTLPAGAALATSSTIARTWRSGSRRLHHIVDPRTRDAAPPVWRTASVAADTCVRANTLTTAALVRGARATHWLSALGAPARLVAADGSVTTLGTWPAEGPGPTEPADHADPSLRSAA
jgi:thiamine biosynthesis lipoprotein